jgi:hypothetical protein
LLQIKKKKRGTAMIAKFARNLLLLTLVALLTCCGISLTAAAAPLVLFGLDDLPTGFEVASAAELDSCQIAGDKAAYVLKAGSETTELVCVSSFSLAATTENKAQLESVRQLYDQILQHPQVFIEQAKAAGVDDIKTLDFQNIGENAVGFGKTEAESGQTEVMLFRRGDFVSSALIRYPAGHDPIVPLKTIARKIDQRISAYSNAAP